LDVDQKSSFNRLSELERLGLVRRKENKLWEKIDTDKELVII
jgi:hypothetical protein